MLICDYCKQGEIDVLSHNVMLTPIVQPMNPLARVDLCKGCKSIFEKKITDLVREIVRKKK
jgi:hypothetical protein